MENSQTMIRRANAGDMEAINRLLRQVLKIHHEGRPDLFRASGKKYTDNQLAEIFANPLTPVFVYEEAGSVLGYAFCAIVRQESGSMNPVSTLFLDDLCIDGSARGKHIGQKLFEYVKTFAREQGCHNITLHVWECNPAAKAFYQAMGMTVQYSSMELLTR